MARIIFVPTPIGNLEDMTYRAVKVLKAADLIAAEDTRTSGVLLKHYEIEGPRTSLHQHNEHKRVPDLLRRIQEEDLTLAVISDAGSPGISDPGFLLAREAIAAGIEVEALPGPTAFVPALVCSGIPLDKFVFEGFLPTKKGRQTRLKSLANEERTMVFYESPYRLVKTLNDFIATFGEDRMVSVSREISKLFEEHRRGRLMEVRDYFAHVEVKGEIVIVLAGQV